MRDPVAPAPAVLVDPRTFAQTLVERGFRLQEVCSVLGIEPEKALELMLDPEVAAHLKRLFETGETAATIPDARRVLESHAYTASMEIPGFVQACREAGLDPSKQSIPAFLKAKANATQLYQKLAHPSLLELFAEAVRVAKARGLKPDHAALRKQVAEAVQEIIETGGRKKES